MSGRLDELLLEAKEKMKQISKKRTITVNAMEAVEEQFSQSQEEFSLVQNEYENIQRVILHLQHLRSHPRAGLEIPKSLDRAFALYGTGGSTSSLSLKSLQPNSSTSNS